MDNGSVGDIGFVVFDREVMDSTPGCWLVFSDWLPSIDSLYNRASVALRILDLI